MRSGEWVRRQAVEFWTSCSLLRSLEGKPSRRVCRWILYVADVNVEVLGMCGSLHVCPSQGEKSFIWSFLPFSLFKVFPGLV